MLDKKFKIYLYFCAITFFFLLGIVLFYSFGYKYNLEENKTVQTGAIIIKAQPEKIDIYKNGAIYKNNKTIANLFSDFVKIEDLESGAYDIKIESGDYFSWEKNIAVESGYVTELKNIVLLKKDYSKNIILNKMEINPDKNNIWTDSKKDKIAYQKMGEKGLVLAVFDFNKNSEGIIADMEKIPFSGIKGGYSFSDIIFSNDSANVILKIKSADKTIWYFVDAENGNKIYDLSQTLNDSEEIKNEWSFYFSKFLFFIKNSVLYKFDHAKRTAEKILGDVSSFLIYGDYIYFFKPNDNKLYSVNINSLSGAPNIKTVIEMPENFDSQLPAKITRTGKNAYLVLSSSGKLYYINNKNEVKFINSSAKKADFSNNDERIIYGNDHEIWIYYIKEKTSQPQKKEFTNELITRFSGNISNVFLYKDEEHLFYREGNTFKFSEIDNRDKRNIFEILEADDGNIFYLKNSNLLYYIKNDKLIQLDLEEK